MINVTLIGKAYGINCRDLNNLFHFVRANKSNRFGSQWYDLLEACSSQKGRNRLDLTILLAQLESMLYFLLNHGEPTTDRRLDQYNKGFCDLLHLKSDQPLHYIPGGEPLYVNKQSELPNVLIAVRIAKEASGKSSKEDFIDSCTNIVKKAAANEYKPALERFFQNLNKTRFYEVCNREKKGKENFALLLDVLKSMYSIPFEAKPLLSSRNQAVHEGEVGLDEKQRQALVKNILLLAIRICPRVVVTADYSFLVPHFLMEKMGTLFSGCSIGGTAGCVKNLRELVVLSGHTLFVSSVALVLALVVGYFIYKDQTVYINFDNVPKVDRIELYDRILTGNLSQEYVLRLQKEIKSSKNNEKR